MEFELLYTGFETCFAPSTYGASTYPITYYVNTSMLRGCGARETGHATDPRTLSAPSTAASPVCRCPSRCAPCIHPAQRTRSIGALEPRARDGTFAGVGCASGRQACARLGLGRWLTGILGTRSLWLAARIRLSDVRGNKKGCRQAGRLGSLQRCAVLFFTLQRMRCVRVCMRAHVCVWLGH